jgi:hypothetical protein
MMPQKELEVPSSVRSYQEYPEIIEFEGCPRCHSLDVNPQLISFKKADIRFQITCLHCGLLYYAFEKIEPSSYMKSIIIEWEL